MIPAIGFPVIVHDQIDDRLLVFVGLMARVEDVFDFANRYTGRISVARVSHSFGQNERIEIHHNIEHYSKRISACYWVYPDEIDLMYKNFDGSWDQEDKQECVADIKKYMGIK